MTACEEMDFGGPFDRYKEDFHQTFALPAGGRLSIESLNGSIEISGWDKDSVEINGTKYAGSPQALSDLKIDMQSTSNSVAVRAIPPSGWHGSMGARFVVHVPRRVELDRITSSNGAIRVEDVEGTLRLKTSNGSLRAARTKGDLDAQTSNSSVELAHTGNARIHTSNGSIRVDLTRGSLDATTSNSAITARLVDPDPNQPIRVESSNGHIDLTTNAVRDIRAGTSNSSITVHLPASVNAKVRAHTSNSSITTDFDVSVRGGVVSKHNLEGTIGSGGPVLDLSTSNGSIKILKL
jgi:DUF4097 and DUF4098 domain-containing protein YvlB